MRKYTKIIPSALTRPYKWRGETVSHATIVVLANNEVEAKSKIEAYYAQGVTLGVYKPLS